MHNNSDDQIGKAGSTGHAAAKRAEVGRARFHVAAQKDAAMRVFREAVKAANSKGGRKKASAEEPSG